MWPRLFCSPFWPTGERWQCGHCWGGFKLLERLRCVTQHGCWLEEGSSSMPLLLDLAGTSTAAPHSSAHRRCMCWEEPLPPHLPQITP